MVFQLGYDYVLTTLNPVAQNIGEQIYCLGGAASKDNFLFPSSVDKVADSYARVFHGFGRLFREFVRRAVNISVAGLVVVVDGVNDNGWLL